jgi:hypothetical protein
MALQRTRRPRFRSGRTLRSLGSPLNARPLGGTRIRSFLGITLVASIAAGCASTGVSQSERRAIVKAGLGVVERSMPGVFVIPDAADQETRAVLCQLRRCIPRAAVRSSEEYVVPLGYFVFKELRISGDEAEFSGTLGPIERPKRGIDGGCGHGYRVRLHRNPDGQWLAGAYDLLVC